MITPYGTIDAADAYLSGRADTDRWFRLSIDEKMRNLRTASLEIDGHRFISAKYDDDQERQFPRIDHADDVTDDGDVPTAVEHATYEQAAFVGTPSYKMRAQRAEAVDQGVTTQSVEGVSETYSGAAVSPLCAKAKTLIKPYLLRVGKAV